MRSSTLTTNATLTALCLLLFTGGFLAYGASGHDDAHITFWAAHSLAEHGNITNYNGDRVQQSSSLLLTVLTAALHQLTGLAIPDAGYLGVLLASAACCALLARLAASNGLQRAHAVLPLLSSTSFLFWSYSGMEGTLAALCLLAMLYSWWRWLETAHPSSSQAVAALTSTTALLLVRPEMPLVALGLAGGSALFYWRDRSRCWRSLQLLAVSAALCGLLLAWQQWYFGDWLPLPVAAKQGGALLAHWQPGLRYLLLSCLLNPLLPLALPAIATLGWHYHRTSPPSSHSLLILSGGTLAIYSVFVITVGGDWMQAARFVVPVLPAASLLLAAWLALWRSWLAHSVVALLTVSQVLLQYSMLAQQSHGIPVWTQYRLTANHRSYSNFERFNQEHLRDLAVIDHLAEIIPRLHGQLGRPVTLLSGQAGMVFYHTAARFGADVRFIDLRGLVENSLTDCAATRDIARAQQGLYWSYSDFFARLPALQQLCGITAPDIIYDINDMTQKLGRTLEPFGYTMLHQESGFPLENRTALPYKRLLAPNMIFVRNELLPLLGNPPKTIVDYSQLPLQSRWPFQAHQSAP